MNNPIFIGSDGRSGSTLLAMILDSHPDLAVMTELHFKGPENLGTQILEYMKHQHEDKLARQFIARVVRAGIPEPRLKTIIQETKIDNPLTSFAERCILIHALGCEFAAMNSKKRYGLKLMRDIASAPDYTKAWPAARFVFIIRNGLDVAASQMYLGGDQHMRPGTWGYKSIERAALGWQNHILVVRNLQDAGSPIYFMRYEDLVEDPQRTVFGMCTFIDLPFDSAMLRHDQLPHRFFDNNVVHPSRGQVREPINSKAVGRHKKDLTQEQVDKFISIAGPTMKEYDYL